MRRTGEKIKERKKCNRKKKKIQPLKRIRKRRCVHG